MFYIVDPEKVMAPKSADTLVKARAIAVRMIDAKIHKEFPGRYYGINIFTSKNAVHDPDSDDGWLGEVEYYSASGDYVWCTRESIMRGKNSTSGVQRIFKNGKRDTKTPLVTVGGKRISGPKPYEVSENWVPWLKEWTKDPSKAKDNGRR